MPAYKDTQGNWYCKFYYTDYEGQRKQKLKRGFTLKREAEAWERDYLQNISFQPNMTFKAFYQLYKSDIFPRLKQHTIQTKMYQYTNRIAPFFDSKPLNAITPQDVIKWQNELISSGYSDTYKRDIHHALSSIFNHAVKFYRLKENPVKRAGTIGSARPQTEMLFYTHDEFNLLIAHIDELKANTAIKLLYWSGIRKGELLALTWEDIDFNAATLRINKSYQRLGGKDVVTSPKTTKSVRTIKLSKHALEALQIYREHLYSSEPTEAVFEWEKRFIELGLIKGSQLSGVKKIRVHDLRHSHASLLIELGYSPLLIAQRLGHEKVETTLNTYAHLWPSKESELIDELNSIE